MKRSKMGSRALALSFLAILGLMAFTAVAAQAEWRIEGKGTTSDESLVGSGITEGSIQVPSLELSISCSKLNTDKGTILKLSGDMHFENHLWASCSTAQKGKVIAGCKPVEPVAINIKGRPILFNSLTYILVEFEPSAVIKFNSETCALPSEDPIKGSFVLECLNEKQETGAKFCEAEMASHFVQPAPEKTFTEDKVTVGSNSAFLKGIDVFKLSGENTGKKWSAVV